MYIGLVCLLFSLYMYYNQIMLTITVFNGYWSFVHVVIKETRKHSQKLWKWNKCKFYHKKSQDGKRLRFKKKWCSFSWPEDAFKILLPVGLFLNIYTCTYKALRVEDIYVYINTLFYREVAQRVEPGKRPGNLAVVRTNTGIIRHNRKTIQLFSLNLFLLYKTLSMLLSRDQLCYNTIFLQVLLCLLYKLFRKCLPIFFGKPAIVYFILGIKKTLVSRYVSIYCLLKFQKWWHIFFLFSKFFFK